MPDLFTIITTLFFGLASIGFSILPLLKKTSRFQILKDHFKKAGYAKLDFEREEIRLLIVYLKDGEIIFEQIKAKIKRRIICVLAYLPIVSMGVGLNFPGEAISGVIGLAAFEKIDALIVVVMIAVTVALLQSNIILNKVEKDFLKYYHGLNEIFYKKLVFSTIEKYNPLVQTRFGEILDQEERNNREAATEVGRAILNTLNKFLENRSRRF